MAFFLRFPTVLHLLLLLDEMLLACFVIIANVLRQPSAPVRPRVEYTEGVALGVDVPAPRFSWALFAQGTYTAPLYSRE